jgi:hypothetical protein
MGTPPNLWKILTLLSLVWAAFFTVPYILKCLLYPNKVGQRAWRRPSELAGSLLACLCLQSVCPQRSLRYRLKWCAPTALASSLSIRVWRVTGAVMRAHPAMHKWQEVRLSHAVRVCCVQIRQEWQHFAMNNAFSVPWMTLVVRLLLLHSCSVILPMSCLCCFSPARAATAASCRPLAGVCLFGNSILAYFGKGAVLGGRRPDDAICR